MSTADIAAAPSCATIGGKTYWFSPLQDKDHGTFERWAQKRVIDIATANLESVPVENRDTFLAHAFDKASQIKFQTVECINLMSSPGGMVMLVYLSLHHRHPEITYDEVQTLLLDPKTANEFVSEIEKLHPKKKRVTKRKPTRKKRLKPATKKK